MSSRSLGQWSAFLLFLLQGMTLTRARSFVKTVDSNGTVLCAVDDPSLAFDLDSIVTGPKCTPNRVKCAWQCNQQPRCLDFNYREDTKRCELYFFRPNRCASVMTCTHSQISNLRSCQDNVIVNYTVVVKTGTATGSGTDANIYLTIYGSLRNTTTTKLVPTYSGNPFENGDIDYFTISSLDLGNILMIKVDSEPKGFFPEWQLAQITISNDWQISWLFQCNCWLQSPSSSLTKQIQAKLI